MGGQGECLLRLTALVFASIYASSFSTVLDMQLKIASKQSPLKSQCSIQKLLRERWPRVLCPLHPSDSRSPPVSPWLLGKEQCRGSWPGALWVLGCSCQPLPNQLQNSWAFPFGWTKLMPSLLQPNLPSHLIAGLDAILRLDLFLALAWNSPTGSSHAKNTAVWENRLVMI